MEYAIFLRLRFGKITPIVKTSTFRASYNRGSWIYGVGNKGGFKGEQKERAIPRVIPSIMGIQS